MTALRHQADEKLVTEEGSLTDHIQTTGEVHHWLVAAEVTREHHLLGALVGEEVDISEAEIISDATSEIKGKTTLKGGPFILNNAKIENCVIIFI